MRLTKFLLPFIIIAASGCVTSLPITEKELSNWSNDKLCQGLGTYHDDGNTVLNIHAELSQRGGGVDHERCYLLENKARGNGAGFSITPKVSSSQQERVFDPEKGKFILQQSGPRAGVDIYVP